MHIYRQTSAYSRAYKNGKSRKKLFYFYFSDLLRKYNFITDFESFFSDFVTIVFFIPSRNVVGLKNL